MRVLVSDLDPAVNLDLWLSSGQAHFWNLAQKTPATDVACASSTTTAASVTVHPSRRASSVFGTSP